MIDQPRNVTSASFLKLDGIIRDLEQYALSIDSAQLHSLDNVMGVPLYMLIAGTGCKAKPFGIPVKIKIGEREAYVVDVRQVTSPSQMGGIKPTNIPEMNIIVMTGLMTAIWDSTDKMLVANLATDLSPIYATWLSSTISAAFNLAVDQRTEVSIVAAYFYWSMIGTEANVDKIIGRIAIDLKLDFERVSSIVDNCGELSKLEDFVTALKSTSAGARLDKFDVATIYQVSTGVWGGSIGRTLMEIAIEFPPYIVALTNAAMVDKSYKRTRFFEYVHLFDRRPDIQRLPEAISHLNKQR